jgi:hypothetical protein
MKNLLLILLITFCFSTSTDGIYDNSWAFIVGINEYDSPDIKNLSYAVNDAKSIEKLLILVLIL